MLDTVIQPIVHPAAWTVLELGGKDGFAIDLTLRHIQAFKDGLARLNSEADSHDDITSARF
ncbi:MAG: hypothetical protein OSB69_01105 [Alphaproteobacteria bacterium]|nr:hypothetical protein [Alphaproteobacteria bacterium]